MRLIVFVGLAAALAVTGRHDAGADAADAGNGIFRVIVEDAAGEDGIGTFTVITGTDHPAGAGREVLHAGASGQDAESSYLTVRSYTTGTDYVQTTTGAASANSVRVLDDYSVVQPIGSRGYRTTATLAGQAMFPDDLTIRSEIEVTGSSIADSAVVLRTSLTNGGDVPLALGVRYLLDAAPGGDDGPTLSPGDGPPLSTEALLSPAPGVATVAPNDLDATAIAVRVSSPGLAISDAMAYASWTHAFPFAFDYSPASRNIARECDLNDSALLIYFGATETAAIVLPPGQSSTVSLELSTSAAPIPVNSGCSSPSTTPPATPPSPTPEPTPAELPRTGGSPRSRR